MLLDQCRMKNFLFHILDILHLLKQYKTELDFLSSFISLLSLNEAWLNEIPKAFSYGIENILGISFFLFSLLIVRPGQTSLYLSLSP